jgi:two-component system, NarL family, invasion response regulator UvrY
VSESFRVLVVDDSLHVRRVIAEAIHDTFPSALIVEAGDGEEGLQKGRSDTWNLVVLDISLPKLSGLEVLNQLKPHQPDLHVIILSLHDEPDYVLQCLEYGASGYLGKDTIADELRPALQAVLNGDNYISRKIAEGLPRHNG